MVVDIEALPQIAKDQRAVLLYLEVAGHVLPETRETPAGNAAATPRAAGIVRLFTCAAGARL